jgi:hypothetical protein
MKVKNVSGSSRFSAPAGYDSWLDYWKKQTNKNISVCSAEGCREKNLVGAHVKKASTYTTDEKWYIVPICSSCNKKTDIFEVSADLVPVPSNLSKSHWY